MARFKCNVLDNDGVVSKTTKEKVKSLALEAKVTREQTSNDSDSQDGGDEDIEEEEEVKAFNLIARNFYKVLFRKGLSLDAEIDLVMAVINLVKAIVIALGTKENKAFIKGAWSDCEDGDEPQNDATCLMEIESQEVCLKYDLLPDDWFVDSGCTKHMTRNRRLFTLYKAYDGRHVIFGSNLKGKVVGGGNITHGSITITNVEHIRPNLDQPERDETEDDLTGDNLKQYELINDLTRNKIVLPNVTINTKFLNCLQPKWYKYVTSVRLARSVRDKPYDELFDYLQQYVKPVIASRAKKLEKTHDPLALVAHTNSSSSRSPPAYYVTHPSFVVDYDDDYQGDTLQNDIEDTLNPVMMLLSRAITKCYSTPTIRTKWTQDGPQCVGLLILMD
ncbi:hypothetical protein Tco_0604809 [Tanacetum coccineum]